MAPGKCYFSDCKQSQTALVAGPASDLGETLGWRYFVASEYPNDRCPQQAHRGLRAAHRLGG